MELSLACPDWEDRIRAGGSLIPDGAKALNPTEFARAVSIFNKLRIPDVPGTPSFAEAGGEWFREIVGTLLGSIDPVGGQRQVRELFLMVAKKNSKTTGSAGLMLTALLMNKRPRVKFLLTGPTQEVSDLAFDQAVGMIENDPDGFLQKRMHIQGHLKTITDRRTRAELRIKTFDMSVAVGALPAGVLFDELHEISKNCKASRIIGQLRGGMLPNPEAFLAFITTQSDEPPAGAFKAELQMARAIRDGRAAGRMLPVLFEFPMSVVRDRGHPPAWQDPANWPMVTPNNGRSITIPRLVEDFEMAKLKGDEEMARWASQHLNIEIGVGLQSDAWPGAPFWASNADPTLTLETLMERSELVVVGIDGGGLDDLLGLAVLGREKETRNWLHWGHAWAHDSVLNRRKDIAAALRDFEADGDLTIVERVGDDVQEVADIVGRLEIEGLLPAGIAVGVDQAGISEIVDELACRGIAPERIGGVPQGWKLNNAIKTTERKLAGGALKHCGSRLMAFSIGNARAEARGNAVTITKQVAGSAKIDPLMALFDAVVAMGLNPEQAPSVYEKRGLLFF
jgi:phage terminase large subunit-like protein